MLNPLANSNVLALKSICSEKSVDAKRTERVRFKPPLDASLTHHTGIRAKRRARQGISQVIDIKCNFNILN